jgi:hypothetical protein
VPRRTAGFSLGTPIGPAGSCCPSVRVAGEGKGSGVAEADVVKSTMSHLSGVSYDVIRMSILAQRLEFLDVGRGVTSFRPLTIKIGVSGG